MSAITGLPGVVACSFCLKPKTEVRRLVAGPGVFICDGCVALCALLVDGPPSPAPHLAAWEHAMQRRRGAGQPAPDKRPRRSYRWSSIWRAGVHKARALGATWARIGEALGMTRQSAWERFSGEE